MLFRSAITDWDQGNICLDHLKRLLDIIFRNEKVIGMDICGEYSEAHDLIEAQKAGLLNELTNVEILEEVKLEGLQSPSLEIGSTGTLNGYSTE